ncbi:hypothetical protein [Dyadobacter sp. NIV53]|uniref:hypothetical protein n=1 Tax=Dyadobacter sp. NIV53 TaxID=2861765 RepID=UPI001E4D0BED|nr:hypothetical protein [Dyadobacter sp. NIV53]
MAAIINKRISTLLVGTALAVLPILYFVYSGVSWTPINPHEHLIQNGLAYIFLVLFSYLNYTFFVPRWFLNKQYARYFSITICCILATAYLPYRIEQWAFFRPPVEHTAQAWIRQIFWEEMMLNQSHSEKSRPPKDDFHSINTPPDLLDDHEHFRGPRLSGPRDGRSLSIILPAKLAIFFCLVRLAR